MKILQINSVCGTGSTGRIAVDLHNVLLEKGHECVIAYGRGTSPDNVNAIKIGNKSDFYAHAISTRISDRHGFYSKQATKAFIEKVKEINPDIIHLHNIHGYYINIEMLFSYLAFSNKSVIWTLHSCWPFTGHCSYFDVAKCEKWRTQCRECPQKKEYPASLVWDSSFKNYADKKKMFSSVRRMKIITPSRWLADLVAESFLAQYPVEVIYNGINRNNFTPQDSDFRLKHRLTSKRIVLGVANIWNYRKGMDTFYWLADHLDSNYAIVLVGLTSKQLKEIKKEKTRCSVIGVPRTNSVAELSQIYSAADVFFNPTKEDNFPTTNIEALASGTPVLTFLTGGSPECMSNRYSKDLTDKFRKKLDKHQIKISAGLHVSDIGIVLPCENQESIIHAIDFICSEKLEGNYTKGRCREASSLFSKEDRYNDYIKEYEEILRQI